MHRHSTKGPIILGTFLILVIIGVVVLATINKNNDGKIAAQQPATTTPVTNQTEASSTVATSTDPTWITTADTVRGYSIKYPPTMSVKNNQEYPPVPGEGIQAMVFTFPKEMYSGGTVSDANVSVAETQTVCATWADGLNTVDVVRSKTIDGHVFDYRVLSDAATSNYYTTYEYSTTQNKQCYRIALFIHSTNPGVQFTDDAVVQAKLQKNKDIEKALLAVFENMVSTFTFTK